MGDIAVVFGPQFRPILNAALIPISVLSLGLQLAQHQLGHLQSRDLVSCSDFMQLITVLISLLIITSSGLSMLMIFFLAFPWASLWPPFFITTPFWIFAYAIMVYQFTGVVVNMFATVMAEFHRNASRINRILSRLDKISYRPADRIIRLRLATLQWNQIRKDLNRSSATLSPILLAFIPPLLVTALLSLYATLFLGVDITTRSQSFTMVCPTLGTGAVLLLAAAYVPWSSRRYPIIMYRTIRSLNSIIFLRHKTYLLKCIKYGDLPQYRVGNLMTINYLTVLFLIFEIGTYFLLLVTAIGRPA